MFALLEFDNNFTGQTACLVLIKQNIYITSMAFFRVFAGDTGSKELINVIPMTFFFHVTLASVSAKLNISAEDGFPFFLGKLWC